jgi:hypothetical protein
MGAAGAVGGGAGALAAAGCSVAAGVCDWPKHAPGAIASDDTSTEKRKIIRNFMANLD